MIDTSNFECVDDEIGVKDEVDSESRVSLINEGYDFITKYSWCLKVKHTYLCEIWEGVLTILLFEIKPKSANVDDSVWVIVGDVPPAYLDVLTSPTPRSALERYIKIIEVWANTVKTGESVEDFMPIYIRCSDRLVEPTIEHAKMIMSRASFIRENILPELS